MSKSTTKVLDSNDLARGNKRVTEVSVNAGSQYVSKSGSVMNPGASLVLGKEPSLDFEAVPKKYMEDYVAANAPAGSGHVIHDEATPLAEQPILAFLGEGVTAANDGPGTRTTVTIPGDAKSVQGQAILNALPTADRQILTYDIADNKAKWLNFRTVNETVQPATPTADTPPTMLMVRQKSGLPALFRLVGGATVSGPLNAQTFSTAAEAGSSATTQLAQCNDAVIFNGKIYAIHTSGTSTVQVYERQTDGSWTIRQSHSITHTSAQRTGLFVTNDGQGPVLCYLIQTGLNPRALTMGWTLDGVTWTATNVGSGISIGGNGNLRKPTFITHRGIIYQQTSSTGVVTDAAIIGTNVRSQTSSYTDNTLAITEGGSLSVLYGRLFFLIGSVVYEVTGGGLVLIATLGNGGSTAQINSGQPLLVPVGNDRLLALYYTSTGGTLASSYWRAATIVFASAVDNAPTVTQCDNVIPTTLRSGGITTNKSNAGFYGTIDNVTDPGNLQLFVLWAVSATSPLQYSKYMGTATELTGTSLAVTTTNFAVPNNKDGGSIIFSADDSTEVRFNYTQTAIGAGVGQWLVKWKFQALNIALTYICKIWLSSTEGKQLTQATLTGAATGGTRVGNQINGCPHNTEITVNVDVGAMGITNGSNVTLHVKVYQE